MSEKNNVIPMPEKNNDLVVTLTAPYTYEEKTYTEINLSGLERLRAVDLFEASMHFTSESGVVMSTPEADPKYCCIIAAKASGLPYDLFPDLPLRDANRIKNKVMAFFQSEG